jgi:hypothetical protein
LKKFLGWNAALLLKPVRASRRQNMELWTIYLVCAAAGGTLLVIRVVLMLLGMDQGDAGGVADAPADFEGSGGVEADGGGSGFNFFSLQSISGFFTMFGLVGMGLLQINVSEGLSLLGALAAGVFTAWATAMIFFNMRRLQSEGTLVMNNAVGQVGTVYLTIPEKGTGAVNVTVQGGLRTLDAMSENGQRIPTGNMVKVVAITAGKILVVTEKIAEK